MDTGCSQLVSGIDRLSSVRRLYGLLARRAYSVIILAALVFTLAVKFFHSWRCQLISEYLGWILADVSVLLTVEIVLAMVCYRWKRKSVVRAATVVAAIVCTWSVMNAAWLIRTGTQILPAVFLPLFRDPINSLRIVIVNLIRTPKAAIVLAAPTVTALVFFSFTVARPILPDYNRKRFAKRTIVSVIVIIGAVLSRGPVVRRDSAKIASAGLRYNSQLRAVMSFLWPDTGRLAKADFANATRIIPAFDDVQIVLRPQQINHNVVIVVLEGVQYVYTSLSDKRKDLVFGSDHEVEFSHELTPYLATLAKQGVEFANARSTVTHTTKALFALLTGRVPSASQDIAEAVPVVKPYASIATIVGGQLNFRTAFFQSARGNFESRPGLIYNFGFDKFWARDDLNDPNSFVGYLGCDEFSMLEPITEWIKAAEAPFLLTILCSITHDPYEVPEWFEASAKEPLERYRQAVSYTDKFLSALDVELAKLNLTDKTILCVVGDHGEAFGEHGLLGHSRIPFEEVLRIPWVIRAPFLVESGTKVVEPVSSVDVTPTLLSLLGFETNVDDFDGVDVLGDVPDGRRVYFADWMRQAPAGFVKGNRKFIYNPTDKMLWVYDLSADPLESVRMELAEQQSQKIAGEIIAWQKNSIFRLGQERSGKRVVFDRWLCSWTDRVCSAKYQKEN